MRKVKRLIAKYDQRRQSCYTQPMSICCAVHRRYSTPIPHQSACSESAKARRHKLEFDGPSRRSLSHAHHLPAHRQASLCACFMPSSSYPNQSHPISIPYQNILERYSIHLWAFVMPFEPDALCGLSVGYFFKADRCHKTCCHDCARNALSTITQWS